MSEREVVVCPTGTANLASVAAGLRRAGGTVRLAEAHTDIDRAQRVVVPGVGSFGAAMTALERSGMAPALHARLAGDRPTLAICVGLQLLCRASEESPGVAGLGVIDDDVTRFPGGVPVPQFGWNAVNPCRTCTRVRAGHAYFANSFRLEAAPKGWSAAMADHGGPFVAALERGALLACQFHPELSGAWGRDLLANWIAGTC